ncbi:WSC domain-containing protein [Colletotrichum higginsianum]|uniref:Putative fungistatic metabolite n=1 Tax=Colletotrichum higginsianum TaxID=80884 RepID=A0A4T0W8R6_9PEZI|nr:putative fungistatic metabolite [Colletotrichum higginsianum]GJC95339.1 WSC domain-containing protein [Colletotrichum higginsianum]
MAPIVRALAALAAASLLTQVTATTTELPPCLDAFQPFAYAGCFKEKGTQNENALDFRSSSDQTKNTVEKCVAECKGNSYRYAGLTYHGVCYCSQTVNSPLLDEGSCNFPCTANNTQTCGGDGAFSVWQDPTFPSSAGVSINDFKSIGCYTDDTDHGRTIAERQDQVAFDTMTPALCLQACADDGYPFAGVEYGGECYCGVVMGNYTQPATSDKCNVPCKGDNTKNCGGAGHVEIYVASKLRSLEPCGFVPPLFQHRLDDSLYPGSSFDHHKACHDNDHCPGPPSTTTKPATTTTTAQVCTTTIVTPATCEYGCGNWCNKNLPDFDDADSCTKAHNSCKLQVNACLKGAGWPGSASCMEFKAWCNDVNSYCSSSCKGKGSCSKKDCYSKKVPKGYKPGTTSVSTFACPSKPTSTASPVTTIVPPPPTGVCKQPSSWWFNYGPGNPVGGIEIPIVTCNDVADDFKAGNQFKLYTESDSRKCKSFGRNNVPNVCQEACKEQYDECNNTYAQGCKTYNNRRGRRDAAAVYARAPEFAKRWFFVDTFSVALNKCKIQYTDCLIENRNSYAANKCGSFATGY